MSSLINIILADSQHLTRDAIRAVLQQDSQLLLIAEAVSSQQLLSLCLTEPPHILLLSWQLFPTTMTDIRRSWPDVKIIVLADKIGDVYLHELLSNNAKGCYLKHELPEALLLAIHTVASGATWFSWPVMQPLVEPATPQLPAHIHLTKREEEVFHLLVQGKGNQEIGFKLGIAERTVEFHVSHVLEKLSVSSRVEAALWAKKHGWESLYGSHLPKPTDSHRYNLRVSTVYEKPIATYPKVL